MTIPLDRSNNVATFATTPSFSRYDKFCERAEITRQDDDNPITSMTARSVIEDDLESVTNGTSPAPTTCTPCVFDSTINKPSNVTSWTPLNDTHTKDEAELLQYHHNLQHVPFSRLREMAKQGIIPRRLANCRTPVCAACMYGRATRKKWKKTSNDSNIISSTKGDQPRNLIAIDQLISPTPGFIAQITGKLTTERRQDSGMFTLEPGRMYIVDTSLIHTARSQGTHPTYQFFLAVHSDAFDLLKQHCL